MVFLEMQKIFFRWQKFGMCHVMLLVLHEQAVPLGAGQPQKLALLLPVVTLPPTCFVQSQSANEPASEFSEIDAETL
jgi:hypothetical protein